MRARLLSLASLVIVLAIGLTGCSKTEETVALPAETPEQVVEKFYQYIAEGGMKTTEAAYKLVSTKRVTLSEGRFKEIIKKYPPGMKVAIKSTEIKKDTAIVILDCELPSQFGQCVIESEVHLELDAVANAWRIDFTGETYDELEQLKAEGGTSPTQSDHAEHDQHQ